MESNLAAMIDKHSIYTSCLIFKLPLLLAHVANPPDTKDSKTTPKQRQVHCHCCASAGLPGAALASLRSLTCWTASTRRFHWRQTEMCGRQNCLAPHSSTRMLTQAAMRQRRSRMPVGMTAERQQGEKPRQSPIGPQSRTSHQQ